MADRTITEYPTMGKSAATDWRNVSGTVYRGDLEQRHTYSKDSMVMAALHPSRRNVHERLGFVGGIQMRHVYPNVPEASLTQRNVRTMPNRHGLSDFWAKRQYGQRMQ